MPLALRRALTCAALAAAAPSIAFAQHPTNQRLYDTITSMPDLRASRIAKFEAEPVVPGRVIFLGNSITQGGDWAKLTGDSTVINRGIGADITFGLRTRLADVTKRKPSKLFVLIGINDISKDIPDAVIAAQYRALIDSVKGGSPVLIVDRGRPVARLEPVSGGRSDDDSRLAHLVREGIVRPARRSAPKGLFATKPPRLKRGASGVRALLEERREGR